MLDFSPLNLEAREKLQGFLNQFESFSDFNYVSLYNWNTEDKFEYCLLDDSIMVLKMLDYITGEPFLTFLGTGINTDFIELVRHYAYTNNLPAVSKMVPKPSAEQASLVDGVSISEEPDNDDYILSVDLLKEMRANLFRGKRNLVNRFERFYKDTSSVRELDLLNKTDVELVIGLNDLWRTKTNQTMKETESEYHAIGRSLAASDDLGVKIYGIFVGDVLAAYVLFELLPNRGSMIHFEKSNHDFIGVGEYLKMTFALHLDETYQVEWINYQQDLGLENLRRAKESCKPIGKLHKYTVNF